MKVFQTREMHEAIAYAGNGEIAIHLHSIVFPRSPACFRDAVARGEQIAHVFGKDRSVLTSLARRLGVRIIVIDNPGTDKQHVDLCGAPLRKLLKEATV